MSAPNAAPAAAPANKGKKLIVIGAIVALVLVIAAAGALFFINQKRQAAALEEEVEVAAPAVVVPVFMPLESMVVNLSDRGGDRYAQIGITLELRDAKSEEQLKQLMPAIRNSILMLTSQRTAGELLLREGKEKLADDILSAIGNHLGIPPRGTPRSDDDDTPRPRNPVRRVLFSSFIVQ